MAVSGLPRSLFSLKQAFELSVYGFSREKWGLLMLAEQRTSIEVDGNRAVERLVTAAFDRAWRFVEKDPLLAHNSAPWLCHRLRAHLEAATQQGERDLLTLANGAIWRLRDEMGRRI
jgi:hypothetical protein